MRRNSFKRICYICNTVAVLAVFAAASAHAQATRDPWQWPFSSTSIWNTPIGSGAQYSASGLPVPTVGSGTYEDPDILLTTGPADPLVNWYQIYGGYYLGQIYFPDYVDVSTQLGNNAAAVLQPDGQFLKQMQPLFHTAGSGRIDANPPYPSPDYPESLFGDGFWGGHSGSGLSSMGGTLRVGELTGPSPIRHALKIEAWGKYLYFNHSANPAGYNGAVAVSTGYRWPAIGNDNYAAGGGYQGTNPDLVQGSLIAIPVQDTLGQPITESSLGLTTAAGKKLFHALQDYGAYMCDDSGGDAINFCTQRVVQGRPGVTDELASAGLQWSSGTLHDDIFRLIPALNVVQNNAPNNVGGGGTPRQPLAPPFAYGGWMAGTAMGVSAAGTTVVEAENYDVGGVGVSYYSGDPVNHGGAYRFDGVTIYNDGLASGGRDLGWIYPGQWMGYTLNVAQGGVYTLSARASSGANGGSFHLEFGPVGQVGGAGVMSSGSFSIPGTGGWSNFVTVSAPAVSLPAGTQWVRFVADTNGYNLDDFSFAAVAPIAPVALKNGSFELPSLGNGYYQYRPSGASWTFASSAGITAKNSAWKNPAAPDGVQAAFVQMGGSISQSPSGFVTGVSYVLAVQAAQRSAHNPGGNQSVSVTLDGVHLGTLTPTDGTYRPYSVGPFTVASAGSHTLTFTGTNTTGDSSLFLDSVALVVQPATSTGLLLVGSGSNILAYDATTGASQGTFATLPGGDTAAGLVFTNGSLYVADATNHTLQKFNGTSFSTFASFGSVGSGAVQQLSADPSGNFYVATQSISNDGTANSGGIVKITPTGTASQLYLDNYNVAAVTASGGTGLAFGDTGGSTGFFEVASTAGTVPSQIGFGNGSGYINAVGLTASSNGNLYGSVYADGSVTPGVYRLTPGSMTPTLVGTGTASKTLGGDVFVGTNLFVVDRNAGTILKFVNPDAVTNGTEAGTPFIRGITNPNFIAFDPTR